MQATLPRRDIEAAGGFGQKEGTVGKILGWIPDQQWSSKSPCPLATHRDGTRQRQGYSGGGGNSLVFLDLVLVLGHGVVANE